MIDIILFASIAAFIGVRLYNALGKKDFEPGNKPAPVATPAPEKIVEASYVIVKPIAPAEDDAKLDETYGKKLATEIRKITKLDPAFSAQHVISGAKKAFEIILKAFANGDKDTLKPLLSRDVYSIFSHEIDARTTSEAITENTLVAILSATIKDITLNNKYARIAVQIVSEQVTLIKDKQGKIIDGNPSQIDTLDEIWTFGRDLGSPNPNWELVETAIA